MAYDQIEPLRAPDFPLWALLSLSPPRGAAPSGSSGRAPALPSSLPPEIRKQPRPLNTTPARPDASIREKIIALNQQMGGLDLRKVPQ